MSLLHSWKFTDTIFKAEEFLENTKNQYRVVSQSPYVNRNNPNMVGTNLTLNIMYDSTDYGTDRLGRQRDSNVLNSFNVTILNGEQELDLKKGDIVSLHNYLAEHSYVIGFDLILRFGNVKKLQKK